MGSIFFEITIIICFAAVMSVIFRILRQPPVLAYLLTGILLGPFAQIQLQNQATFQSLGQLGVTLLLFMLGLEMKLKEIKMLGTSAVLVGTFQVITTGILSFLLCGFFNFSYTSSLFVSIALTFSSTIVIVGLLYQKKDLGSLYGKILVGALLVQDFFAIGILMVLATMSDQTGQGLTSMTFVLVITKSIFLFLVVFIMSRFVFPRILKVIGSSSETLFLVSIAWVFGLSALVSSSMIGFSVEIGGFLAGLTLANSFENFQIAARAKALRDFFIVIFFVSLGMRFQVGSLGSLFVPLVVFSLLVLIGKPIITMIFMSLLGFRKRTAFLTGIHTGQVSEFSLVILSIGTMQGYIPQQIASLVTMVGIIAFALSTYSILHDKELYQLFGHLLSPLEQLRSRREMNFASDDKLEKLEDHIVVVGGHHMGERILEDIRKTDEDILVVDFNPDIIRHLHSASYLSLFGDITDPDIAERARLSHAKLLISTVPDLLDNLLLLKATHKYKSLHTIVVANDGRDAKRLYSAGADYVVLPDLSAGKHVVGLVQGNFAKGIKKVKTEQAPYIA